MFRNRSRVHSLVSVLLSDSNEIRKRVWHGQLTVVFPYLEERRIHILSRIRSFLGNANLRDQQGNPTDLEELELGSIYYFIRNSGAPPTIKDEVRLLRDLRHELAHLRPIELSLMGRFLRYTENASSHTV